MVQTVRGGLTPARILVVAAVLPSALAAAQPAASQGSDDTHALHVPNCVGAILDVDTLHELAQLELPDPASVTVRLACKPDDAIHIEIGDERRAVELGDVERKDRARVLALTIAELAEPLSAAATLSAAPNHKESPSAVAAAPGSPALRRDAAQPSGRPSKWGAVVELSGWALANGSGAGPSASAAVETRFLSWTARAELRVLHALQTAEDSTTVGGSLAAGLRVGTLGAVAFDVEARGGLAVVTGCDTQRACVVSMLGGGGVAYLGESNWALSIAADLADLNTALFGLGLRKRWAL